MNEEDDLWVRLARLTPARIGLGRAGAGLPTREVLKFGLAHAQARDAVHEPMHADAIAKQIEALGFATIRVASRAENRETYLRRPDWGRALDDAGRARLDALGGKGLTENETSLHPHPHPDAAPGIESGAGSRAEVAVGRAKPFDLALVVADGLSARAIHENAVPMLAAMAPLIAKAGWRAAPIVIAEQARVALGDAIGAALEARLALVLIGERPGLSSPDSLGLYLTYHPKPGRSDAERNCISNVRKAGLGYEAAAARLAWLIEQALARGLTGVALKDESDAELLATAHDAKALIDAQS